MRALLAEAGDGEVDHIGLPRLRHQAAAGKDGPALYTVSFSIMIGLLVIALVCNELIRPVSSKWHEAEGNPAKSVAKEVAR